MADKAWKANERRKCRELGGVRTGPMGRDLPDCSGVPLIGLEAKLYKRFAFLESDFQQAADNARKLGLIPVLAVKEKGRGGRDRVELDWDDFVHLYQLAKQGAKQ